MSWKGKEDLQPALGKVAKFKCQTEADMERQMMELFVGNISSFRLAWMMFSKAYFCIGKMS